MLIFKTLGESRMDGKLALKLQARDDRRRARKKEKDRSTAERREASAKRVRARAKAYKDRHEKTITPGVKRPRSEKVCWTKNGISKLHPYSTRDMIMRWMREHLQPGEVITVDKLAKACEGFLYGDPIRPFLRKLEEAAHIEYVYDKEPE
jgi:hypothetical protein